MTRSAARFREMKRLGQRIAMLTCYDYPTALIEDAAGIDVLLVGDSVGTNVLGYASEREVTLADVAHHVRAVRRGVRQAYVLADLPFGTYDTPEKAVESARSLAEAGADGVKLEGAKSAVIAHLVENGIEVCGHVGLEPQTHTTPTLKGKTADDGLQILTDAEAVASAGASMIVLELVPEELARVISLRLDIPTIGIGAGRDTDGQVLVVQDLLGITARQFRHNRRYAELRDVMAEAFRRYKTEVSDRTFPGPDNVFHMPANEAARLVSEQPENG